MLKVEGHSNLIRDEHSKAIINTDRKGYEAAVARKKLNQKREEEFLELKSEVKELKGAIQLLLEKLDK